jgi:DNA modification methylase
MPTFLQLSKTLDGPLPPEFHDDEVRYPPSLVRHFLAEYTHPCDRVFDPFAGYGTTVITAEAMGRFGYGVELDAAKAAYARRFLQHPENLVQGDARDLSHLEGPPFQFVMTSPPYMGRGDPEDPLSDYRLPGKGYAAYLRDLRGVFAQLRRLVEPAGSVVVEAANLKAGGQLTTLAWDLAAEIAKVLHFEGEVVIGWDRREYGYDHSYCLVFSVL